MAAIATRLCRIAHKALSTAIALLFASLTAQGQPAGTERLGKALDYMMSGKYHEALLIFRQLDREYELNDRYKAYIGLCYYQDWDYRHAAAYFDRALPHLAGLAPHERSVYYYAAGESHFQLQNYRAALPYYQQTLAVCYDNERGDVYFRIAFCHLQTGQLAAALDACRRAQEAYTRFRNPKEVAARQAQLTHMIEGIEKNIQTTQHQETTPPPPDNKQASVGGE